MFTTLEHMRGGTPNPSEEPKTYSTARAPRTAASENQTHNVHAQCHRQGGVKSTRKADTASNHINLNSNGFTQLIELTVCLL